MSNRQSIVRGAFFIVASEFSFALGAALVKLLSESLPNESIVFFAYTSSSFWIWNGCNVLFFLRDRSSFFG